MSLFEALHTAGGVLVYGIPEFRLPKAIVANEVEKLKAQGVEVMTDMVIGKVLSIDELFEMGFKAVFIGSGAGLPMFMHIPGESLKGRLLCKRVSDPYQSDEGVSRRERHADPALQGSGLLSAAATLRWMPPAVQSVWVPIRCTSSTAAARPKCPPDWKSSTMRRKRASSF